MMNMAIRVITTLVLTLASSLALADIAIITNADTKVGNITSDNIRNVFLGERKSFPNGIYAHPINHTKGSPDRDVFFSRILSMSENAHDRHWKRMQATSTTYRPEEAQSYEDLLESVRNTAGSISYINAGMVDDTVKVLMVIKTDDDVYDGNFYANNNP